MGEELGDIWETLDFHFFSEKKGTIVPDTNQSPPRSLYLDVMFTTAAAIRGT